MTNPIAPNGVVALKKSVAFPPAVIEAWNNLIAQKWGNGRAYIDQNDAIAAIIAATGVERHEVFEKGWLDIEDIYRAEGWKVVYDKPGYCENYVANFTFTAKG